MEPQNPAGFTPYLREICAGTCGDFGDPPCWRIPEMIQPCDEIITPCAECLAEAREER